MNKRHILLFTVHDQPALCASYLLVHNVSLGLPLFFSGCTAEPWKAAGITLCKPWQVFCYKYNELEFCKGKFSAINAMSWNSVRVSSFLSKSLSFLQIFKSYHFYVATKLDSLSPSPTPHFNHLPLQPPPSSTTSLTELQRWWGNIEQVPPRCPRRRLRNPGSDGSRG